MRLEFEQENAAAFISRVNSRQMSSRHELNDIHTHDLGVLHSFPPRLGPVKMTRAVLAMSSTIRTFLRNRDSNSPGERMLHRFGEYLVCESNGSESRWLADRLLRVDDTNVLPAGPVIMGHFNYYYFTFQWSLLDSYVHADERVSYSIASNSTLYFRFCDVKFNTLYLSNSSRLDEAAVNERIKRMGGDIDGVVPEELLKGARGWLKAECVAAAAAVLRNVRRSMEHIDGNVKNGTVAAVCKPQACLREVNDFVEAAKLRTRPERANLAWEQTTRFSRAVNKLTSVFKTAVLPEFTNNPVTY
jgi:hypothetical protein